MKNLIKLFVAITLLLVITGCDQSQGETKKASDTSAEPTSSRDALERAFKGSCTKILTYEQAARGEKCK